MSLGLKARIALEKQIARAVVTAAIAAGYTFGIDNGGDDDEMVKTSALTEKMNEMFQTDDDRLYLYRNGKTVGWIWFVYGNDGWDVISDYIDKPEIEALMTKANEIAEKAQA